jgi:hypothetical protein
MGVEKWTQVERLVIAEKSSDNGVQHLENGLCKENDVGESTTLE